MQGHTTHIGWKICKNNYDQNVKRSFLTTNVVIFDDPCENINDNVLSTNRDAITLHRK